MTLATNFCSIVHVKLGGKTLEAIDYLAAIHVCFEYQRTISEPIRLPTQNGHLHDKFHPADDNGGKHRCGGSAPVAPFVRPGIDQRQERLRFGTLVAYRYCPPTQRCFCLYPFFAPVLQMAEV